MGTSKIQNGPKMADGVWKGVYSYGFGCSPQLSLNEFFDLSTPMRKVVTEKRIKKNSENSGPLSGTPTARAKIMKIIFPKE